MSPMGCLRGHKRGVWSVQFSPVDKLLASAAADDTICIWLLDTMTLATVSFYGEDVSVRREVSIS